MNLLQDLPHALFVTLAFIVGILPEEAYEVIVAAIDVFIDTCFDALLVVSVEDSQKKVHEQEQADRQIGDKEETIATLLPIRGQHDVREVRSCQQHEHVEE